MYIDESGAQQTYSYQETRLIAASLARYLRDSGTVGRGESVVIDLPNCPAYIVFLLAAGYGGFSLVLLNHRLTAAEKESRVQELERMPSETLSLVVDESNADALVKEAVEAQLGEDLAEALRERTSGRAAHASYVSPDGLDPLEVGTDKALGRAQTGRESRRRRRELARQDVVGSLVHYAEQAASIYDRNSRAAVMFTSGTTGRPKAAPLLWRNLCASAEASNAVLNQPEEGLWQAVLPLYHVGGLEVVIRSILNHNPFVLYRRFDADLLITDVRRMRATHVSVVDKMLQDMIGTGRVEDLRGYECILLGGGPLNPATIERVKAMGLNVYASYGMTETCSQIANALVTPKFYGGMDLLPGCQARVVDPDKDGYGRLAVRAPSVIDGYLNARTTRTADGYFLTGDTGAMLDGKLYVKERTDDMFVSGGEKIYPAEIREKILHVPGVSDAYVFGVRDEKWGRRPVAFVERERRAEAQAGEGGEASGADVAPGAETASVDDAALAAAKLSDRDFAASVRKSLSLTLSKINLPQRIFVVDELPRMGIGKTDRSAIARMYDERIEVTHVMLYRIRLPFNKPFKTPKGTLKQRESVLVEVTDYAGRTGLGECVAFSTDWYLPETLDQDVEVLRDVLAPAVTHEIFLHPREASRLFQGLPRAKEHPMACAAMETALWDLYGKIVGRPLWQLVDDEFERMGGGRRRGCFGQKVGAHARVDAQAGAGAGAGIGAGAGPAAAAGSGEIAVPAGAVIGLGSANEAVSAARACVAEGYTRIKLKVAPGGGSVARVKAVREVAPQVMLTLDANQSFSERNLDELREMAACGVEWIEEPLDLSRPRGRRGAAQVADPFERLAKLQRELDVPICLDESVATLDDLKRALLHPELRCYVVKIGKLGGVEPALEFLREARRRGLTVWMGGMYDTGVSKRLHAAFQTLPGVDAPGDIGATSRYFSCDVTEPPYEARDGKVTLNGPGHEAGLGCELDREALAKVLVSKFRCS